MNAENKDSGLLIAISRSAPIANARTTKKQLPYPYLEATCCNTMMKFIHFVILEYEVGFNFAVARRSHRSQGFLCDESEAAGAQTGDPNRRLACFSSCGGCGKARRLHT